MKIIIDTKDDSVEDLKYAIEVLQQIIKRKGGEYTSVFKENKTETTPSMFNMFDIGAPNKIKKVGKEEKEEKKYDEILIGQEREEKEKEVEKKEVEDEKKEVEEEKKDEEKFQLELY